LPGQAGKAITATNYQQWRVEPRFLKPSTRRHLPTANQVPERVLTDWRPAPWRYKNSLAVTWSSHLNQFNRLPGQMVLPDHAGDLDLLDRFQTHRLQSQAGIANPLPSHSDGNFHQQLRKSIAGTEARASHAQPFSARKALRYCVCPAH